jgi:periplasmic divalent cation tolerance protein
MIAVYITSSNIDTAKKISRMLLEKRLIACANIHPIHSLYWWKDKIEEDDEYAIIAKTEKENYKKIEEEVIRIHDYDVPCIDSWDIDDVNPLYEKWLKSELSQQQGS